MTILVTGGGGFLGKNLQKLHPEWIFINSKECDLTDYTQTMEFFSSHRPDAILHLAARVGGIKKNAESQADFYRTNTLIDVNVLSAAHELGIERVLSSLSTCAFPDILEKYPFSEEDIMLGPPADSNYSYGMTKRMLHVASEAYRKQYKRNYSTFSPSNLYGPHDHFGDENSHFVASLIYKVFKASDGDQIEFWGTGNPLRQQLYVEDLCSLIPILLEKHNDTQPLIVAPRENLSIKEMVYTLIEQTNKSVSVKFSQQLDGQYRKDGSNSKLMKLIGDFEFTSFNKGVNITYNWYMENH